MTRRRRHGEGAHPPELESDQHDGTEPRATSSTPRTLPGSPENQVELLWATLNAVPDAVLIVSSTGQILAANDHVESVFGWTADELSGRPIEVLVPPRMRPDHPRRRGGYTRRPMGLLQLPAIRRGGDEFTAEISLAPVNGASGLTAATVRDITGRLELEAETERVRDELLATVTHELRTPLTSIIGYTELLRDTCTPESDPLAAEMLAAVERNARRELRLVSDLLALATSNLGDMSLRREETRLGSVVEEAVQAVDGTAASRRVALDLQLEDQPGPPVLVDRAKLLHAIENLLSNAVKFTNPGGSVRVQLRSLEESHVLTVADTGVGIPAEDQPRVFERMFRGPSAARSATPGAGIGLALAKSVIDAHGGLISLHSAEGVGTTVTIQLPRRTT